jgi:hypothetical protein
MIDNLMKDLERLREAERLLERIWAEIDVYSAKFRDEKGMSPALQRDMRRFFKFDDSE